MREELLHFIWQHKLYLHKNLQTTSGLPVEVINPGVFNTDAGPDFFNSKIKIGNTLWAGNVEVHVDEGDWIKHKHDKDKSYDNVILHVVDKLSSSACRTNGQMVPTLKLNYNTNVKDDYENLKHSKNWLACANKLYKVSPFEQSIWFERMLIERLEEKSIEIERILNQTENDWDETFYRTLFRSFGFGVNSQPFEQLAQSVSHNILLKYADSNILIEALLLGQSGFLNEVQDDYLSLLKREYLFLKHKHKLKTIDCEQWKFLRLRPSNFPTVRISQLSRLMVELKGMFGCVLNANGLDEVRKQLNVKTTEYWENHYLPDKKSVKKEKKLGEKSQNIIIINTIIPLLFFYGKRYDREEVVEKALYWLRLINPEKNSLIDEWTKREILVKNAADSQALIYLSKKYCKIKKCLHCSIGHKVLTININT